MKPAFDRPFASLTAGLLARKGQARPAMRPQGQHPGFAVQVDDLGWNDMGHHAAPPTPPAALPEPVRQQAEIAQEFAAPRESEAATPPRSRAEPGAKGKAAFTLRLDPARHLRLRLACAARHRSAQQMVTQALDAFLNTMPELDALADAALPPSKS